MVMRRRQGFMVRALLALLIALALTGCSTVPTNQPITNLPDTHDPDWITSGGYRQTNLAGNGSSDELLVLMASSGGGKRSAAFSYGVLRGLRDFQITIDGHSRRLLDEVDTI